MTERWHRVLKVIAVVGALVTVLGFVLSRERTCAAVLLAAYWVVGLGLGGLLFVAFSYVTRAGWSVALRRVPEAMAGTLPLGAVLMVAALVCIPWLYEWYHSSPGSHAAHGKSTWLSPAFFVGRAVVYLAVWIGFGALIRRVSRRQDAEGGAAFTARNTALSAFFIAVFFLTFSLACFDWIMSLEVHWFSTVFALYNFAGLFLGGLAVITLLLVILRRGPLRHALKDDHFHDLGRLTFAFATFWAYLWFCQYMLIWYANIPEETGYFVLRQTGAWGPLHVLNPILNWMIPFLVLLPRPAKRSRSVMLWTAVLLLLGRWLDLYLMVAPPFMPSPRFGLWEIGPVAVALPLFGLAVFRVFGRTEPVPRGDPMLADSLSHET